MPQLTAARFGAGACSGIQNMFDQDTSKLELRGLRRRGRVRSRASCAERAGAV